MLQGAILAYWRYANIKVWYFFVFSHEQRRYAELSLSAYLLFAGNDQAQGIQYTVLLFPVNCETTVFLGALSVTVLSITKDIFVYLVSQFVASGV
jgi:hypothetical protein